MYLTFVVSGLLYACLIKSQLCFHVLVFGSFSCYRYKTRENRVLLWTRRQYVRRIVWKIRKGDLGLRPY